MRLVHALARVLLPIAFGLSILASSAASQGEPAKAALVGTSAAMTSCEPGWLPKFGGAAGMNDSVVAFAAFDDGSGPALHACGRFTTAGGVAASHIAKWDGATWSPLGSGMTGGQVAFSLAVFDDGSGPALYAGGDFTTAGGVSANYIARWDGSTWSPLGSGMSNNGVGALVSALAVFDDGSGPALYAGGFFTAAGGVAAIGIAKWDGATWSGVGGGMNAHASALTVFDDGTGPALYAGGDFTTAGGVAVSYIAKWDGSTWSPLGSGVSGGFFSIVSSLTVFDDGTGAALYAGGNFTTAGGVAASRIAKWDGSAWSPLGSGVTSSVNALTVFDDGAGPALYAGGSFLTAGGVAASRIAKWDGSTWSALGSGMDHIVFDLTGFDDGSGSALHAGGLFSTSGGVAANAIAKWGCTLPAGARTFGTSSPGCTGPLAIGVTSPPTVGNAAFALTCSNAPPSAPGAFFAGTAFMAPLPILGIQIWVSPIVSLGIASSASGTTTIPLPLPPDPMIVGGQFDVQTLWLGSTAPPPCPVNGLSASNALELTIQP